MHEIAKKYATKAEKISKVLHEHGIIPSQVKRIKNKHLDEHYFDIIDSHPKAYFIGLLLADGSVIPGRGQHQDSLAIELVETDKYILDYLKKELGIDSQLLYDKRKSRKHGTFVLRVRSNAIVRSLAKYGIVQRKTDILTSLPKIEDRYLPDLLRGLIDGDGSIYFSGKHWHINFTGHNFEWVYSFMDTVRELIGKRNVINPTNFMGIHKIIFNGSDVAKIIERVNYLNTDCVIPRKRSLAIRAYNEIMGKDIVCSA